MIYFAIATLTYSFCNFLFFLVFLPPGGSIYFNITRFDHPDANNIVCIGDAEPSAGAIELNKHTWGNRVGWATCAESVQLWDPNTGKLSDCSTQFSFTIDTMDRNIYGSGFVFFLAPFGFQIPPNSVGDCLGSFNTSTLDSSPDPIILVEFDSFYNPEFDPPHVKDHVGINNNSIVSSVYTRWNASFHSGDTADVRVTYNANTKNLSMSWTYRETANSQENTSLLYIIDLMKVLPQSVTIGFSAATGEFVERHTLNSWEFSSILDIKKTNGTRARKMRILIAVIVSILGVLIFGAIIGLVILPGWKQMKKKSLKTMNLSFINDDLARDAGPRRFSYKDLASATNNFSDEGKLGEGGFGDVYKGHLIDLDMDVAVKKISRWSKQGEKEYITEVKTNKSTPSIKD